MTGRVLLLSPSRGLGGGIERYVATLEWAFAAEGVKCQRLDLSGPGACAHARLLARGRAALRADSEPARLVVAHRALLPVAALLARDSAASGVSVLCHGSEMWGSRWRPRRSLERRLMRGAGVRVVAVSNFTAGALMRDCRATVLPPALSREWFDTLAAAAADGQGRGAGIRLATAFRLAEWQGKGLPQLVAAVAALGRPDVCLTVCGSGNPPTDLLRLVSELPLVRSAAGPQRRRPRSRAGCGGLVRAGHGDQERPPRRRRGFRPCPAGGAGRGYAGDRARLRRLARSLRRGGYRGSPGGRVSRSAHQYPARPAQGSGPAGVDGQARQPVDQEAFAPERYAQIAVRRLL